MGMTDAQFDAYKQRELRHLERVQKEIAEQNAKSETLDTMVEDLKGELKKP
jgi:hypothetical protein